MPCQSALDGHAIDLGNRIGSTKTLFGNTALKLHQLQGLRVVPLKMWLSPCHCACERVSRIPMISIPRM
eukprot:3916558-Pyramimonas_sp.AAC.1